MLDDPSVMIAANADLDTCVGNGVAFAFSQWPASGAYVVIAVNITGF
jgi:hypothetical protein